MGHQPNHLQTQLQNRLQVLVQKQLHILGIRIKLNNQGKQLQSMFLHLTYLAKVQPIF